MNKGRGLEARGVVSAVIVGGCFGLIVMLIYTFILGYSEAEQVTIDCEPTNMYAISEARKMRIYDCGDDQSGMSLKRK